jgi:hypothetical protein
MMIRVIIGVLFVRHVVVPLNFYVLLSIVCPLAIAFMVFGFVWTAIRVMTILLLVMHTIILVVICVVTAMMLLVILIAFSYRLSSHWWRVVLLLILTNWFSHVRIRVILLVIIYVTVFVAVLTWMTDRLAYQKHH